MAHASGKRALLLALVASLVATAALAIGIVLFGDFGETEGRILATTGLIASFSLLALPAGLLLDARRLLPLAWASLALAGGGLLLALAMVWDVADSGSDTVGKLALTLVVFAVASAQVAATASRLRREDPRAVAPLFALSTALVLVVAAMAAAAAWAEIDSETYFRLLAAGAVADVLLVALQPIVRRMGAPRGRPAFALRLEGRDGASREVEIEGRDLADAVARAVRAAEREGVDVARIELLAPRPGG